MTLYDERDRQGMLEDLDRIVLADGRTVRALFDDPFADALDSVGTQPTVVVSRDDHACLPVGTRIDEVCRSDGSKEGPFRVRAWRSTGGGFYTGQLEAID